MLATLSGDCADASRSATAASYLTRRFFLPRAPHGTRSSDTKLNRRRATVQAQRARTLLPRARARSEQLHRPNLQPAAPTPSATPPAPPRRRHALRRHPSLRLPPPPPRPQQSCAVAARVAPPQAPAHPCPSSEPRRPDRRRPAVVSTNCRLRHPLLPTHPSAPSAPPYPLATAQSFGAARSHPKARPTPRLAPRRQAAPAAASLRLSTKLNNMPDSLYCPSSMEIRNLHPRVPSTPLTSLYTDRHCYLERRLRLARASAAQNRAERIIPEVAGTHRSSRRTIRLRAPLRCGAPRTTSRHQRPRSRAASEGATRRRHQHPPAAAPAPPAPRAGPGRACPRR